MQIPMVISVRKQLTPHARERSFAMRIGYRLFLEAFHKTRCFPADFASCSVGYIPPEAPFHNVLALRVE